MVWGQILDDTTVERYNEKTVHFRREAQMVTGFGFQIADTSLRQFSQQGDFLYQESGWYQNLGVFGSAARPLFFQLPKSIGLRSGYGPIDYLVPTKDEVRYYNTLSPHSDIQYFQGARQRAMLRGTISQNILSGLNITAHYQRLTAMRTINVTQAEERQTDHHSAYISTNYSDSLGRYKAWGHYQHQNHLEYVTGGIQFASDQPSYRDSLFVNPEIYPARLDKNARFRDLRNNWYFSQIWKPGIAGLYLRSSHFRTRQTHRYGDPGPRLNFYGQENLFFQKPVTVDNQPIDTLWSERVYRLWENAVFLGFQNQHIDFSFYLKNRDTRFASNLYARFRQKQEWVYGAQFSGRLGPGKVHILGEWISPKEFDLQSTWTWAGFQAEGRLISYKPSLAEMEFVSKNLLYITDFQHSNGLRLSIRQQIAWRKWQLIPAFEHLSVADGITFLSDGQPVQQNGFSTMQWLKLGLNGQIGKRFFTENQIIRTFQSGERLAQMPSYAYHSAHWVEVFQKKKGYAIQAGFNLDWRYDWPSMAFYPINGQWYITDNQRIQPYILVDAFIHIRMNKTRIYAKVHNTLQGLGSPGYFATPNYQAQRRLFQIGLVWYFFD